MSYLVLKSVWIVVRFDLTREHIRNKSTLMGMYEYITLHYYCGFVYYQTTTNASHVQGQHVRRLHYNAS